MDGRHSHIHTRLYTACWDRERNASRTVTSAGFGLLKVILAQFRMPTLTRTETNQRTVHTRLYVGWLAILRKLSQDNKNNSDMIERRALAVARRRKKQRVLGFKC